MSGSVSSESESRVITSGSAAASFVAAEVARDRLLPDVEVVGRSPQRCCEGMLVSVSSALKIGDLVPDVEGTGRTLKGRCARLLASVALDGMAFDCAGRVGAARGAAEGSVVSTVASPLISIIMTAGGDLHMGAAPSVGEGGLSGAE
jgi:hypothetical protein